MNTRKHLRTGSDPRSQPDYIALRDEMMKLTHPARPDVNWHNAEIRCLRLFEHNGVELQSAAWYTLARMHIAGVAGMNEGLALINALAAHQWSVMWPVSIHVRMEIITGLNQRLQAVFRTQSYRDPDDLAELYQAQKELAELSETLGRHELKQTSQLDVLRQQITQVITRLENLPPGAQSAQEIVLPAQAVSSFAEPLRPSPERLVYIVPHEPTVGVDIQPHPGKLKHRNVGMFLAGAGTALMLSGIAVWGWDYLNTQPMALAQLKASLTPLPGAVPKEQRAALSQYVGAKRQGSETLKEQTREQLNWLATLPPDWQHQYSRQLLSQATFLLPYNTAMEQMTRDWQQQAEANALALSQLNGWQEGMAKLEHLADKLNTLDEKRGKYMTVSELKSQVFGITEAFRQHIPAEERLRQLIQAGHSGIQPAALQLQTELHIRQLLYRYSLINMHLESPVTGTSGKQ